MLILKLASIFESKASGERAFAFFSNYDNSNLLDITEDLKDGFAQHLAQDIGELRNLGDFDAKDLEQYAELANDLHTTFSKGLDSIKSEMTDIGNKMSEIFNAHLEKI